MWRRRSSDCDRISAAKLIIAGQGSLEDEFRGRRQSNPDVEFVGAYEPADLDELLGRMTWLPCRRAANHSA